MLNKEKIKENDEYEDCALKRSINDFDNRIPTAFQVYTCSLHFINTSVKVYISTFEKILYYIAVNWGSFACAKQSAVVSYTFFLRNKCADQ